MFVNKELIFSIKNKTNAMIKYSKSILIIGMFLQISGLVYADG